MREWIKAAKSADGITVKKLEGALLRAEERLRAKLDSTKDPGITFEVTGVDYLCVDEAHGYKNLRTPSNISDAAIDGSKRATDLDMKIDYLRRRNGRRVVTFATATPIANSVTEAYVMQRYLRPDLLAVAGIEVFDGWAATFGQVVSQVELAPEGGSNFRMKSRFARFANVPEMLRMLHVAADVKTAEDLALPVPNLTQQADGQRTSETVTVEPSDELLSYVRDLGDRAAKVRNRAVDPDEDNMLKISGDGRRAALDLRLLGLPQTTPGKISVAADRIATIWSSHQDDEYFDPGGIAYPVRGSLQLVFCDLGTPGPHWNAYDELRDQLVARGLPYEAVRFIHEAKTDRDKAQLFAASRAGRVAVLVGSTERMGVGTNVQDRAIALHHLDAPWRPADVAQRDGRILRQGNLNPWVEIIRYVTERSFDGYMWQTLERKARFIGQMMHGRLDTREIADIGDTALSFSEVKAIATGNPLLIDKAEADATLSRLQRAERAHLRNQDALRHAIGDYEAEINRLIVFADSVDTAIARRQDTRGENFTMTVDQVRHDKRADAGQHVKDILEREAARLTGQLRRAISLGNLGGFPVSADVHRSLGTTNITLSLEGAPDTTIDLSASGLRSTDPVGLVTRLENRLTQLETRKASALADIEHARRQITHARDNIGQPFPHAGELTAARERAREIDEALDRMAQQDPGRAGSSGQEAGSGPHKSGGHLGAAETGTASGRDDRHISAQPEQAASPAAGPGGSRRIDANHAAVAANQAYRAGDLDQARQLIDQAAALDPSRAGLWQQHREQIAARRLILDARAAVAAGDRQRADKLLGDARQLDPRMPAIWDGDLETSVSAQSATRVPAREAPVAGSRRLPTANRIAARAGASAPQPGISAQADQAPSWPASPARSQVQQPGAIAAADSGSSSASPSSAAPAGPRLRPGGTAHDADARTSAQAARDPACWPAPDPHATGQNLRPVKQADPEPETGLATGREPAPARHRRRDRTGKERQPSAAGSTQRRLARPVSPPGPPAGTPWPELAP